MVLHYNEQEIKIANSCKQLSLVPCSACLHIADFWLEKAVEHFHHCCTGKTI